MVIIELYEKSNPNIVSANRTPTGAATGRHRFSLAVVLMVSGIALHQTSAQVADVNLGTAADFAVLAGAGITVTGPTSITGDIGTFPTTTITGIGNVTLDGVNHAGDSVTQLAKTNLFDAYTDAAARTPTTLLGAVAELGGLTLMPGVYNGESSLGLTGILTLDAMGDPDAIWIFQAASTLITASASSVNLIGGAQASNIFWQVGSSATLGTNSDFAGNILASESITATTNASIDGGLYALNGAVTLDSNAISVVPEPGSLLLLAACVAAFVARRRRVSCALA